MSLHRSTTYRRRPRWTRRRNGKYRRTSARRGRGMMRTNRASSWYNRSGGLASQVLGMVSGGADVDGAAAADTPSSLLPEPVVSEFSSPMMPDEAVEESMSSSSPSLSESESSSPSIINDLVSSPEVEEESFSSSADSSMDDGLSPSSSFSSSSSSSSSTGNSTATALSDSSGMIAAMDDATVTELRYGWIKYVSTRIPEEDETKSMEEVLRGFEGAVLCGEYEPIENFPRLLETMMYWQIPMTDHFFKLCVTPENVPSVDLSSVPEEGDKLSPFAAFFDAYKSMDTISDVIVRIDSAMKAVFPDCDDDSGCELLQTYADLFADKMNARRSSAPLAPMEQQEEEEDMMDDDDGSYSDDGEYDDDDEYEAADGTIMEEGSSLATSSSSTSLAQQPEEDEMVTVQ